MTDQKKDTGKDRFQAEFDALPLDQKFARLMKMEATTLNETLTYVANATMKGVEKLGDMMNEFGAKLEKEAKKAAASTNNKAKTSSAKGPAAKPKGRTTRKSPPAAK